MKMFEGNSKVCRWPTLHYTHGEYHEFPQFCTTEQLWATDSWGVRVHLSDDRYVKVEITEQELEANGYDPGDVNAVHRYLKTELAKLSK